MTLKHELTSYFIRNESELGKEEVFNTLEILNSSHNYTLEMVEASILRFTFDNIMLLDSSMNETESHGFVSYKIEQIADNEINTVIENEAYIYFDYNQPILTAATSNKIWEIPTAFDTISFISILDKKQAIKIYPNPAKELLYLDFSEKNKSFQNANIQIYDTFGRLLLTQKINENLNSIDISSLENGMYVYKIMGENAVLGSGKIIVQ